MKQPLRVAVIGAGHMGRHHARVYGELEDCDLVAVIDKDLDRAREIAGKHGGVAVTRVSDVTGEIDAVTVAVPTVYHAEVAIPLLERGVPVLVEKPLAPDTKSAKQLLDASRKHNCLIQVGHSERFNPVVQAMLRMEIKPRFIETSRISPFTFRSADIGVVFDMMIHDIDIALHLVNCGQERDSSTSQSDRRNAGPRLAGSNRLDYSIDAVGVNVLGSCEDVANARIRFGRPADGTSQTSDDQIVVNLTASRLALKTERKIRIFAPSGYLSMDYQKKSGVAIKIADNLDLIRMAKERNFEDLSQMQNLDFGSMVKIDPIQVDDVEPLRAEIESFLASVRADSSATSDPGLAGVSAEDGYAAVEMAERITEIIKDQAWSTAQE